ncbi:hypothetical protein HMPREF1988_00124 [Porphyromonas gingivalis F0185]|nr:hypothetical protein HMPREF1988_00124 [Porphyromonas gingivalis F0185]
MRKNLPNRQIKCDNPHAEASTNSKQLRQKVRGNRKIISTQPLFIIKSGFQENPKI